MAAIMRMEAMRPMRYRNYRLYWIGYFISNAGSWMQSVAQALLILKLGGSSLALGAVCSVVALGVAVWYRGDMASLP